LNLRRFLFGMGVEHFKVLEKSFFALRDWLPASDIGLEEADFGLQLGCPLIRLGP